jgi:hypothetical protein
MTNFKLATAKALNQTIAKSFKPSIESFLAESLMKCSLELLQRLSNYRLLPTTY